MKKHRLFILLMLFMASCDFIQDNRRLFKKLDADDTGISFSNDIIENDSVNILDYYYCYNGGGVAVGDLNNDDLQDVFFTGNMVSSRLYLNQGTLQFKDITEAAGVSTEDWIMGVSLVDINADGWLDMYLSVAGPGGSNKHRNLLFVNNGVNEQGHPSFTELASVYGLADSSYSVQSIFFDYDLDGDLDMYLMTNNVDFTDKTYIHPKSYPLTGGITADRLYKNVGVPDSLDHPYYVDASEEAGIKYEGYGLGVAVEDLNADGWPDIYVANDFMPNDLMYINQQDGSFEELASKSQRHQSYNGMGVDIADINNDLLPDIMVLDMLPRNNERRKSMMAGMSYEKFIRESAAGYIPQFVRNTVQMNRGKDPQGVTHFSDISQLTGLHDTDWSWGPLFADFDNDGFRDVYITNGFVKDITDLDFANYVASATAFGTEETKKKKERELTSLLKEVKIPNYIFKNNGSLAFEDMTEAWGVEVPSFSNGAAYADLDNDGDLDIITNNINEEAFIFENRSNRLKETHHYLKVLLKGSEKNVHGIGAKIIIWYQHNSQYYYHSPVKGYLSSINTPVHFGLGNCTSIDSMKIFWSDGKYQLLKDIEADQVLKLEYSEAKPHTSLLRQDSTESIFKRANEKYNIHYKHLENSHNDFYSDPLLPRQYSKGGPGIAVGDIDHKNGMDFFIGSSAGNPAAVFLQNEDGTFTEKDMNAQDAEFEDMGALFFDADNDGDQDLYVVSGGSEFKNGADEYQDRLYINDGGGNFTRSIKSLPEMYSSGSCVVGADYDKDGDIDLFVGGRYRPGAYPTSPRSYLLENEGGIFKDITTHVAQELDFIGMVSSAVWTDFDHDGWVDLIVVGEWMPVTFFQNQQGNLVDVTSKTGLKNTKGWWNSIYPADIDHDGDIDYIVGNMGTNIDYKPAPDQPVSMFAYDFDDNGQLDPILSHYIHNSENEPALFPFHGRDDLFRQLVMFKKQFKNYESYGKAELTEVIPDSLLSKSSKFTADLFETCIIENKGNGKFDIRPLPVEAQFSSAYGIITDDFNDDDHTDLLIVGNSYSNEVVYGWQDASLGLYLTGDGKGNFIPVMPEESGLFLGSDIKGITSLYSIKGGKILLAAANSDSLVALTSYEGQTSKIVYARPQDAYAEITYRNGTKRKEEFYYGAGYLSQSARAIEISGNISSIDIVDYKGNRRAVKF